MKAIITVGISASGKTTWAREQIGYVIVSRDDYRWRIMRESGLKPCWKNWKWKWEDKVTAAVDKDLAFYADAQSNLIIADTNLNRAHLAKMEEKLRKLGYEVEVKVFAITYDEAVERDNARADGVGYSVIQKQYQQFLDNYGMRVAMDKSKPKAAIVDIDGTVALMEGIRSPFEWDKVHLDKPNLAVIAMVQGLARAGYYILFTSGRDGCSYGPTLDWLDDESGLDQGYEFKLLMREAGDQRKDTIVKHEIFMRDIFTKYNVEIVLDDRPSVCRMWRDLGLNVVQVGNPYVEF